MRRRRILVGVLLVVVAVPLILLFLTPVGRTSTRPSAYDPLTLLNLIPDQPAYRAYATLGNVAALPALDRLILHPGRIGPDTATRQIHDFYGLELPGLEWFAQAGGIAGDRVSVIGFSASPRQIRNGLVITEFYEAVDGPELRNGSLFQARRYLPAIGSPFLAAWLGIHLPTHIALFSSYVVTGSEAAIRDTLTGYEAEAPSLGDDPAYRAALITAAQHPGSAGRDDPWLAVVGDPAIHNRFMGFSWENLGATRAGDTPLPNFAAAAFALRCAGQTPYLTWALAFPPGKDAAAAAEELAAQAQWFIDVYTSGRWRLLDTEVGEAESLPVAFVVAQSNGGVCFR